jgi:hypothetical protein
MERYYFFDSNPAIGDRRRYSAADWSKVLSKFLESGVYKEGDNLKVTAKGTEMAVTVGTGVAFLRGHMYENDSPLTLNVDAAEATLDRIDLVVLRLDRTEQNRYIKAFVKKGEAATNPVPPVAQDTVFVKELALAQVRVTAGKSIIEEAQVTDRRPEDYVDPFVNGSRLSNLEENAQMPKITTNEGYTSIDVRLGENVLNKIVTHGIGFATFYAIQGAGGMPVNRSIRGISHMTNPGFGWVIAWDWNNNIYTNYLNENTWRGWRQVAGEMPYFIGQNNNTQSIPTTSWTLLNLPITQSNEGGGSNNGGTYTVPTAGIYAVTIFAQMSTNAGEQMHTAVFRNGNMQWNTHRTEQRQASGVGDGMLLGSTHVRCEAGDTLGAYVHQNSGQNRNVTGSMVQIVRVNAL